MSSVRAPQCVRRPQQSLANCPRVVDWCWLKPESSPAPAPALTLTELIKMLYTVHCTLYSHCTATVQPLYSTRQFTYNWLELGWGSSIRSEMRRPHLHPLPAVVAVVKSTSSSSPECDQCCRYCSYCRYCRYCTPHTLTRAWLAAGCLHSNRLQMWRLVWVSV